MLSLSVICYVMYFSAKQLQKTILLLYHIKCKSTSSTCSLFISPAASMPTSAHRANGMQCTWSAALILQHQQHCSFSEAPTKHSRHVQLCPTSRATAAAEVGCSH
jgi:hypothetical protein